MIWKNKIVILLICFVSCKKESKTQLKDIPKERLKPNTSYYSTKHLIECEELMTIQTASNIKIIDFRKPEAFLKEHLVNAINIWRTDIEDNSLPYKGIIASRSKIEALFSRLGIKQEDDLVIYDDSGACDSSRLWWLLKNYGFHNVKILNGGLTAWKHKKGRLTSNFIKYDTSNFKFPLKKEMTLYASLEDIKSLIIDENTMLLDTRNKDEFSGKRQKKGASRGGHIPNSILLDWAHAVNFNTTKKFKSYKDLLDLYQSKGITKEKEIYVYCHSGVRSAHTTFVLTELLGYKNVKNYDGSWIEWSFNKDLPVEQDTVTTIFK
ncbi:sulfurtransferase [Flavivirga rizhaonensis]|uniref:Sulfurtransferase n=1 Tax=Flavivirga rizhaonensis TaxID=2559571 RepID=A0A4S1DSD3_9FLAO|nr:sulfurtransferase [Flavivirga rizhaonensis]TGV00272.1 sulfurtransferase [Flavivirga rizhaonensis]